MQSWVDQKTNVGGLQFSAAAGGSAPNTVGFADGTSSSSYPYVFVYYQPRIGDYSERGMTARS